MHDTSERILTCDMLADEASAFDRLDPTDRQIANTFSIELIHEARRAITPYIKRTPTIKDASLSRRFGANVYMKLEMLQNTGAFKVRGAFNKMLSLTSGERRRGVVAVSAGNHAQAVAYAAQTLGVSALILMPESTPRNYIEQTIQYGARIETFPTLADAFKGAEGFRKNGLTLIHPFDDKHVIAGQGTIGLEILEDVPKVTDVIVSIGGGGLAGGIAIAIKSLKPETRIWGVETKGADSMAQSLAAGKVVQLEAITSIARTLGAPRVGELTFSLAKEYLSGVTVVSDAEALAELFSLLDRTKVLTEPAASCTVAAAKHLQGNFGPDSHVVLVLCGGNFGLDDLARTYAKYAA